MKDALLEFLSRPLVIGLMIGLAVALFVGIKAALKEASRDRSASDKARALKLEIDHLKQHLHTQMEITAKGNEGIRAELAEKTKETENLKATLNALQAKPGRGELRALHLFEKSIRIMNSGAPGFAPAWEKAMTAAEFEVLDEESGVLSWIRKPFHMDKGRLGVIENSKCIEDMSQ